MVDACRRQCRKSDRRIRRRSGVVSFRLHMACAQISVRQHPCLDCCRPLACHSRLNDPPESVFADTGRPPRSLKACVVSLSNPMQSSASEGVSQQSCNATNQFCAHSTRTWLEIMLIAPRADHRSSKSAVGLCSFTTKFIERCSGSRLAAACKLRWHRCRSRRTAAPKQPFANCTGEGYEVQPRLREGTLYLAAGATCDGC